MLKSWAGPIGIMVVVVVALGVLRSQFGGVAETPVSFTGHPSLTQAVAEAQASDKPVLALVTADWCPPCQALKREGLADARVSAWIDANAVTAYVDATDGSDAQAIEAQQALGIEAYPTLVLLRDGQELGRQVGAVPAGELLAWLETTGG